MANRFLSAHLLLVRTLCLVAAVAFLALAAASPASAATFLDPTFGVDGIGGGRLESHYRPTGFDAAVEQADGSLRIARDGVVVNLLSNGQSDLGFQSHPAPETYPVRATQADGKTLVDGGTAQPGIQRLNTDGTPDASFHGGESEAIPAVWDVRQIVPRSSGKILVAGSADTSEGKRSGLYYRTGVVQLNADGTLDRGFGEKGLVLLSHDKERSPIELEGLVPDEAGGGVLVVSHAFVLKLGADGKPDRGYGIEGALDFNPAGLAGFRSLADGGIVLAGTTTPCCFEAPNSFLVSRFGPEGKPDLGFGGGGGGGIVSWGANAINHAEAVLWGPDGSITVGGSTKIRVPGCVSFCRSAPALARFTPDGQPVAGFGSRGLLRFDDLAGPVGFDPVGIRDLAPRSGGGWFAAGSGGAYSSDALIAAFGPDGTFDRGFGADGLLRERRPVASRQRGGPVAVDSDGRILVALATNAGPGLESGGVVRYSRRGAVDRSYGDGKGYVRSPGLGDPVALAIDSSHRSLVLDSNGTVARFTAEGRVDTDFGQEGLVELDLDPASFRAIAVLPSGKIVTVGATSLFYGPRAQMLVARLLPNGRFDPTFGSDGIVRVGCRLRDRCHASDLAVQGDGRILLVGKAQGKGRPPSRVALARLLSDGSPDRSFGGDGFVTLAVGRSSGASAVALAGSRILVGGWTDSPRGEAGLLARFRFDGRLDRGFGGGGVVRQARGARPTAVLPATGRIVVLSEDPDLRISSYRRDGRPVGTNRLADPPGRASGFDGALQGGAPVLAWTPISKGGRASSTIRLARLTAR